MSMSLLRRLAARVLGLAALALAGCAPGMEPPAMDYNERYPVRVRVETVAVTLPFARAGTPFDSNDQLRLASLVAGYLDRGHGPITIVAPAEPREIRDQLVAAGVPTNAIRTVVSEAGAGNAVTLRYERYVAMLPQCGDWTGSTSRNPLNDVHSNFGCAMQNNLGVMVADPADLVRMRDASATDTQNANRVIQRYRAGEPPAAIPTPLQSSGAAGTTSNR
jgi:pilus assembly protein CpaD